MRERFYRLPAPVRGRFALLADLHNRPYGEILRSLERRRPEFICFAGDFLYGSTPRQDAPVVTQERWVLPCLEALAGCAPLFVSLGNHEWMVDREDLSLLRGTGARVLDNEFLSWGDYVLGGLTSATVTAYRRLRRKNPSKERYPSWPERRRARKPPPELGWLRRMEAAPGYKILLSHHPEYWSRYLRGRQLDLVLSGHAHGGQIRLLGRGLFAPGQGLWPEYTDGLRENLLISRGLANTAWPIPRLFNPREIVYVDLGGGIRRLAPPPPLDGDAAGPSMAGCVFPPAQRA